MRLCPLISREVAWKTFTISSFARHVLQEGILTIGGLYLRVSAETARCLCAHFHHPVETFATPRLVPGTHGRAWSLNFGQKDIICLNPKIHTGPAGTQESFYTVNTVSRAASTENRDVRLRLQKRWTHNTQDKRLSDWALPRSRVSLGFPDVIADCADSPE